ncbi:hypothetical protein MRQ36_02970 [Micromonospora sp. R77]|uniref:hypothetical protein n=1 Tax=Micromonospora sp. R77 TaxID=2925836 RepID=UPI001F608F40|nr:hypothetical protein [Micromonospora sp. R77]MCI4061589.1 hypothetical protein [Micromonospora sp. R77]
MRTLIPPTGRARASLLAARAEHTAESFARHVAELWLQETPCPVGWVPDTTHWRVGDDETLGRIVLRHRLAPVLDEVGGRLGYEGPAGTRRRGTRRRCFGRRGRWPGRSASRPPWAPATWPTRRRGG